MPRLDPVQPPTPLGEGVVTAEIAPSDEADYQGRLGDFYVVELDEGDWVRLWADSTSVDTTLEVRGPGDVVIRNDDFVPGTVAPLIQFQAPVDGDFLVRVQAYAPRAIGPYQVGLVRLEDVSEGGLDSGGAASGVIGPNGAGPGLPVGASFWIEARGGERLRFRVTSSEFDTTAALIGPSGQVWINDDAGDTGPDGTERPLDSTVTAMAPVPGHYQLLIVPYAGAGGGRFRLRSTRRPPVILAEGEAVPSVGYAGREGDGRILGLFVGITDYQEGRGQLYGCADDATLLAQAFRERHLMSEAEQSVLTDLNANQAAFIAGLQRLAAESTEQDVVVIFYSGHGGSIPAVDSDQHDLDGTDETLVLVDGSMRDDEVVALIDQITADVIILALDSCHSGGFARDFLTRPGRIGLFSSDEDVLSDTAEPLLAGGYLSYVLRRAVLGEADAMPIDGTLFAGELTDYLHASFVEHNHHMNPAEATSPRQWLVSRRGSIGWNDVLWLYPRGPEGELLPVPEVPLQSAPPTRPGAEASAPPGGCP